MIEHIDFDRVRNAGIEQCQRLFHGRGKAYPGLEHIVVDWLPPVALITLYAEDEHGDVGRLIDPLRQALPECESIQIKYRCREKSPYELVWGRDVTDLNGNENGLYYHLQLGRAQNIGLFLDMRNGREWVRANAKDKNVLNLFAYTCAFSVAALAGGASQVVNIDVSKAALSRGRDNHRLNQQDLSKVKFEGVDIFKSFARLKKHGPYDLFICDPPQFQKGSVDIKRDYKKIIRRLPEMLKDGAQLMLCLNSPDLDEQFLHDLVDEFCPDCRYEQSLSMPEVFADVNASKGLKVMIFSYQKAN